MSILSSTSAPPSGAAARRRCVHLVGSQYATRGSLSPAVASSGGYAAADKAQSPKKGSKARKEEQATINDAEWGQMLDDAKLIDKMFTLREATMIFVKVNLQDELFHASDQSSFDSAMECTYDEFALMIGRLVREKVPPNPESTESFEETLNTYLELILLPTFKKTLVARKKARIG